MFWTSPDTPELMDFNKQGFGLILESVWGLFQQSHSPHHSIPQCRDLIHLCTQKNPPSVTPQSPPVDSLPTRGQSAAYFSLGVAQKVLCLLESSQKVDREKEESSTGQRLES